MLRRLAATSLAGVTIGVPGIMRDIFIPDEHHGIFQLLNQLQFLARAEELFD
jgi:hypothetical protein